MIGLVVVWEWEMVIMTVFFKGLSPSNYIGVAWEAQIMKNPIPMERYDQRMPAIVTEQGVIHVI